MKLALCIVFVGFAHFAMAQTSGGSNFDFSSFNSATSGGASAGTFGSPTGTPLTGTGTGTVTATGTGGPGTLNQFPGQNAFPTNVNAPPGMATNPNMVGTPGQMMTTGQVMNNGQMMPSGQMLNNGQMVGNGQMMPNGQMLNNGQMTTSGQMMANGQMLNNGQMMSNGQVMANGQVLNNQMMSGQTGMMNGQMVSAGQNMLQNGMFQDPTRMGALSNNNFNQLAFNPNTQSNLFQNQLNAQNMPQFGGQSRQFGGSSPFGQSSMMQGQRMQAGQSPFGGQSPFMSPQMVPGPFGPRMFGAVPASPFTGRPGFGIFQDPFMNAFAPPSPFLGQPRFFPSGPMMVDSSGNLVSTGQQSTAMTTPQGQGSSLNSFAFPSTSQTSSFNFQPGFGVAMTNSGMFPTATSQVFDASSGMPIGTASSVFTTTSGQVLDPRTGMPVMSTGTMTTGPSGMTMSSGNTNQMFPTNGQTFFSNTGMTSTVGPTLPFALPTTVPGPFTGLTSMVPVNGVVTS